MMSLKGSNGRLITRGGPGGHAAGDLRRGIDRCPRERKRHRRTFQIQRQGEHGDDRACQGRGRERRDTASADYPLGWRGCSSTSCTWCGSRTGCWCCGSGSSTTSPGTGRLGSLRLGPTLGATIVPPHGAAFPAHPRRRRQSTASDGRYRWKREPNRGARFPTC